MDVNTATEKPTGTGLLRDISRRIEAGSLPRPTGSAQITAVRRILGLSAGWESRDIRDLDVEQQLERFEAESGADYTPGSLSTYKTRFRKAVAAYLTEFDGQGNASTPPEEPTGRIFTPTYASHEVGTTRLRPTTPRADRRDKAPPPPGMERFTFNVRPGQLAYLELPVDLTKAEAKRLAAFVDALAVDDLFVSPSDDGRGE